MALATVIEGSKPTLPATALSRSWTHPGSEPARYPPSSVRFGSPSDTKSGSRRTASSFWDVAAATTLPWPSTRPKERSMTHGVTSEPHAITLRIWVPTMRSSSALTRSFSLAATAAAARACGTRARKEISPLGFVGAAAATTQHAEAQPSPTTSTLVPGSTAPPRAAAASRASFGAFPACSGTPMAPEKKTTTSAPGAAAVRSAEVATDARHGEAQSSSSIATPSSTPAAAASSSTSRRCTGIDGPKTSPTTSRDSRWYATCDAARCSTTVTAAPAGGCLWAAHGLAAAVAAIATLVATAALSSPLVGVCSIP
mmetsp:Transcript_28925/g.75866  ORF Transcript_28925/g.75866 Transcript_28925/m.75866 type:complete len:313 (-) Transcript_28925:403-1341(-)